MVHNFTNTKKSCVLLASLKAGGVGLNLIAATHVVIIDLWWNYAAEAQAVDRIHRFGQTKPVFVKRFLINSSIEEKIILIQERKQKIVGGALKGSKKEGKSQKGLEEDLMAIFAD